MSLYSTYFHLRVKDSNGNVLKTFSPHPEVGRQIEAGIGTPIVIDIEKLDYSQTPYLVGFRQVVKAILTDTNKYIRGLASGTGSDKLEDVLNNFASGGTLEYSINANINSGWTPCNIKSFNKKKLANKNVGVIVTIEVESQSANITSAFDIS